MLFHRRTRAFCVCNGCLAWYNVVLTPRIHSSVKYSQLSHTNNICDVSDHAHVPQLTVFHAWLLRRINNTSYHTRHPCRNCIATATVDKQYKQKYNYHFSSSSAFMWRNAPNQAKRHSGIMPSTMKVVTFL